MAKRKKTIKSTLEYFNMMAAYISDRLNLKLVVTYNRSTKKFSFKEEEINMMHSRIYLREKTEEEMDIYLDHLQNFAEFFRMYNKEQSKL